MESRRVGRSGLDVSTDRAGHHDVGPGHRRRCGGRPAGGVRRRPAARWSTPRTSTATGTRRSILGTLVPDVVPPLVGGAGHHDGRRRRWPRAGCSPPWTRPWPGCGTDAVDLWQVHGFDAAVPFEETCSALAAAVTSGRAALRRGVRDDRMAAGHPGGRAAAAEPGDAAGQRGERVLTARTRTPEESVLPAAAVHGVGLLAWAPLGRGVLTGKYRHATPADSRGASPHFARYVGRHRTEHGGPGGRGRGDRGGGAGHLAAGGGLRVGARPHRRRPPSSSAPATGPSCSARSPRRTVLPAEIRRARRRQRRHRADRQSAAMLPDRPGGAPAAARVAQIGFRRAGRLRRVLRGGPLAGLGVDPGRAAGAMPASPDPSDVTAAALRGAAPGDRPPCDPAGHQLHRRRPALRRGRTAGAQEIPARWASRLVDALGDGAAAELRADPWRLLVLPDASVAQADRLARAVEPDVSRDDPRRGSGAGRVDARAVRPGRPHGGAASRRRRRHPRVRRGCEPRRSAAAIAAGRRCDRVDDPAGSGEPWVARQVAGRGGVRPSLPDWRGWCGRRRRWRGRATRSRGAVHGPGRGAGRVRCCSPPTTGSACSPAVRAQARAAPCRRSSRLCRDVGRDDRAGRADRPGRQAPGGAGRQQRHHDPPAAGRPAAGGPRHRPSVAPARSGSIFDRDAGQPGRGGRRRRRRGLDAGRRARGRADRPRWPTAPTW